MQLSADARRVLGSLVEKSLTTPDQYPLSVKALLGACNQRSARDPVMALSEADVQRALRELRDHDLARTSPVRGRVARHEETLARQLDLDVPARTVLGVLLLRGPQTVGEIRTRTERWHEFGDLAEVEEVLAGLAHHPFLPLVEELPREPGRREPRWTHLLAAPTTAPTAPAPHRSAPDEDGTPTSQPTSLDERVTALEEQLAALRDQLAPLLGDDG